MSMGARSTIVEPGQKSVVIMLSGRKGAASLFAVAEWSGQAEVNSLTMCGMGLSIFQHFCERNLPTNIANRYGSLVMMKSHKRVLPRQTETSNLL